MYKGVIASVMASILFGGLYFYVSLFKSLGGQEVLGWRILLTLPMVTVFMMLCRDWGLVREVWQRIKVRPFLAVVLVVNAALLWVQFWLFMWAPVNGRGLQVSLGYFLLPLVMVFIGRYLYGEHLSTLKKLAVACAVAGVVYQLYNVGSMAWETGVVALGFPFYFVIRRHFGLAHLGSFWFEMALMFPISLWFVTHGALSWDLLGEEPSLYVLIAGLGLLSTTAWVSYVLANKLLPFSLFGLLGYLEPMLLVCVSLLLGEAISPQEQLTYGLIWCALLLLIVEGVLHVGQQRRVGLSRKMK